MSVNVDMKFMSRLKTVCKQFAGTFVLLMVASVVIGFLVTITIYPAWAILYVFSYGAIPYTLVATVFAIINRRKARKAVKAGEYLNDNPDVENFKTRWQRITLVLNALLAIVFVGIALTSVFSNQGYIESSVITVAFFWGGITASLATMMIACNTRFIYKSKTIQAEEYALANNTEAAKYIRASRIWSWVTWYTYSALTVVILLSGILPLN